MKYFNPLKKSAWIKKKANIMLLVLFIMFISSLLWLLVSQYVRNMIKISWLFEDYYATYYYAYAWLELGLSQINYRERNSQKPFGFEDEIVFNSFSQCKWSCDFTMDITSRGTVITDSFDPSVISCTWGNAMGEFNSIQRKNEANVYLIEPWDGFIVPLFYDASTWFNDVDYQTINYFWTTWNEFHDLQPTLYNLSESVGGIWENYIVRIIDDDTENYLASIEPTIWAHDNYANSPPLDLVLETDLAYSWDSINKNYMIVANATWDRKDFCLQLDPVWWSVHTELPTKYITVSSVAELNGAAVAFGAIKNNDLPSFIIYGTISTD